MVVVAVLFLGVSKFRTSPGEMKMREHARNAAILATGEPAVARILSIRQLGLRENGTLDLAFTLEVRPTSGATFSAECEASVPLAQVPNVQPGGEVRVMIDRESRAKVVVEPFAPTVSSENGRTTT
jgi:hypothetical protein